MTMSYWERFRGDQIKRRRVLQLAALGGAGAAAAALVGCGGESGSSSSSADGPLASSQTLRVRFYDDPGGFDPATLFRIEVENIAFNVYSGLTTYEPDGKIVPDLAASWENAGPGDLHVQAAQRREVAQRLRRVHGRRRGLLLQADHGPGDGLHLPRRVQQRRLGHARRTHAR